MSTLETFRQAAEARKKRKEEEKKPKPPEVQNMTIGEAFRRAAEENPNSLVVQRINEGKRRKAAERSRLEEERRFAPLRMQFERVGRIWFDTEINKSTVGSYAHNRIPIEQKKELWMEDLIILKNTPPKQRIELLRALASGMQLAENNTLPAVDAKYRRIFRFVPFVYSADNLTFTRPSAFFMEGISDMSGHSEEQKQEFRYFMVKKSGLTGKVGLPQLFPSISRWLDHAK